MTITARYPDRCATCGQSITPGQAIEWTRGTPARHTTCPTTTTPATGHAPARGRGRTNQRAASCDRCGTLVLRGAGSLWQCGGGDTGCMEHFDEDDGGWHVSCLDATACATRRTETLAAQDARRAVETRHDAVRRDLGLLFTRLVTAEGAVSRDLLHEADGREILTLTGYGDRLYGGGAWLVIEAERIVFVRNNGADGDDWSANLVRTGGAGAQAWLPTSLADARALVERARELAEPVR